MRRAMTGDAAGDSVEVAFELELGDVIAARRYLLVRSWTGRLLPLIGVVVVAEAVALRSGTLLAGAVTWMAVMGVLALYVSPRRAFRTNPKLHGRQRWVLSPERFSYELTAPDGVPLGESSHDWRAVARVHESPRAFLLGWSSVAFMVLPKHALDAGQVEAVRALIAAHAARPGA
jgi:hypothetical protein